MLFKTTEPRQGNSALKQSSKHLVSYKESLQLYYNPNDELAQSIKITQQGGKLTVITTDYQYDAFGRRIHKHNRIQHKSRIHPSGKVFKDPIQTSKTQHEHVSYLWDGNRQLQEQTATHVFTTVYEQDSFEPVARLVWLKDELLQAANDEIRNTPREVWEDEPKLIPSMQVYHYHNDHLGTPNELTNQDGEVIWLADYEAWGNTAKIVYRPIELKGIQVSADELQPLRFQGQFVDTETGLHYNRFRYYDPDLGMFVSRDPIGLMGGSNVFAYAPNPTGWIDPFGLARQKNSSDTEGINCNLTHSLVSNALALKTIAPNTTNWRIAVATIRSGGNSNFRVKTLEDAKKLLQEGRGNMNKVSRYTSRYVKGYEIHPSEATTNNAPFNNLGHIKWKDWSSSAKKAGNCGKGHIFISDDKGIVPLRQGE